MSNKHIVIGDSDGLIATLWFEDVHFTRAQQIIDIFEKHEMKILFPTSIVVEACTTLQRKLNKPDLAERLVHQLQRKMLVVEPLTEELLSEALLLFNPLGSKQNTLFDAVVAVTARKYNAEVIFSFDDWYRTMGFGLAVDLIESYR